MNKLGGRRAGGGASLSSLNNVLMQMRKNCNHPDLITAPFEGGLLCVLWRRRRLWGLGCMYDLAHGLTCRSHAAWLCFERDLWFRLGAFGVPALTLQFCATT
mgnify:CR=1 FL=1